MTCTARRIGRRLMRLLPARPVRRSRPRRRSLTFPVDGGGGPCVGCGRPALVTITFFGDIRASHCPARWRTVAAMIKARGDRLTYTPAARAAVNADFRRDGEHPPRPG
jgi:hypothetical protein